MEVVNISETLRCVLFVEYLSLVHCSKLAISSKREVQGNTFGRNLEQVSPFKKASRYACRRQEVKNMQLTRNSHAIAPIQRVPYHGPVSYGNEGLWKVFRVGGECSQRHPGAAQNHSLEARRWHA